MNLRQLRSLSAVTKLGSFAAAGNQIGLSHAAISIQMQQLEDSLGVELFDRSHRPAALTTDGTRIAAIADEVLNKVENIRQVASGAEISSSVTIGFIPTCVQNLLPRVLTALRNEFPGLQVKVKSGLSGELSAAVVRRELDYALLTTPSVEIPDLNIFEIASEPLSVIGPVSQIIAKTDVDLVRSMPYIAFNRRTWVGQHIAARLQQRNIHISESIEIDSLEAIENLVAAGFGVSIVPQRLHTHFDNDKLVQIPFGNPVETRQLALIQHANSQKTRVDIAIRRIFQNLPSVGK